MQKEHGRSRGITGFTIKNVESVDFDGAVLRCCVMTGHGGPPLKCPAIEPAG